MAKKKHSSDETTSKSEQAEVKKQPLQFDDAEKLEETTGSAPETTTEKQSNDDDAAPASEKDEAADSIADKVDEQPAPDLEKEDEKSASSAGHASVKANTHTKKRPSAITPLFKPRQRPAWHKPAVIAAAAVSIALLFTGVGAGRYYSGKTMPGVSVAGISSAGKTKAQLRVQLQNQQKQFKLTLKAEGKELRPNLNEIGYQIDQDKTLANALDAKRRSGVLTRLAFWKQQPVPVVVSVNDTLLHQYLEANTPALSKPAQDAQLQFDAETAAFVISGQADGQGPDGEKLKHALIRTGQTLRPQALSVGVTKKGPTITKAKLEPLLAPANELIKRRIVLSGQGYSYVASRAEIANWLTPTPQKDGSLKLVVEPAKIQSYVDGIGKRISNAPQDRKIIKDEAAGTETVLQEGQNGTELADKQALAGAIAAGLNDNQDVDQAMNIQTAAYKTVNMNAYDKWVEVDLSDQRLTAYEKATPMKSFLISSGLAKTPTVTGEFSIWLKVRSQTMKGGSRATGDFYDLPNVEWVSYFYQDYAIHGAYWHNNFGRPMSHGCVNARNGDSQWVFEWAPVGTKVLVHS